MQEYSVGTGVRASAPNALCFPTGLHVAYVFSVYAADTNNDRIQAFKNRSSTGTTLLEAEGLCFIDLRSIQLVWFSIEMEHSSLLTVVVIGSFIISGRIGRSPNQPWAAMLFSSHLSFGQRRNLVVFDRGNQWIQKYLRAENSCCELRIWDRGGNFVSCLDFYSRLLLCSNASGNENASTSANQLIVGLKADGHFIDRHDHIYVADRFRGRILVWTPGNANAHRSLSVAIF